MGSDRGVKDFRGRCYRVEVFRLGVRSRENNKLFTVMFCKLNDLLGSI